MSQNTGQFQAVVKSLTDSYLSALLARLESLASDQQRTLRQQIEDEARATCAQNTGRIYDQPAELLLNWSSLILASYRRLLPMIGDRERVLEHIRFALTDRIKHQIEPYIVDRFGISPATPDDAFERVAENFKLRGEARFGKAFIYEQEVQDGKRSFVNIRKCFFNDFFRANGAAEVTPVFCALDLVWADELKKEKYGVHFERPTVLSQGDDMCRFQFFKESG
jgi:hypothetical protein